MRQDTIRPSSAADIRIATVSAVGLIALLLGMMSAGFGPMSVLLACLLAIAVPVAAVDLMVHRVHRRQSAGLGAPAGRRGTADLTRVAIKLLGLWFTLALIAVAYWVFPEYRSDFYAPYFRFLQIIAPVFVLLSVPYFVFVDRRMDDPHDGYWLAGRLALGKWPDSPDDRTRLRQHFMGWAIKAFFLPLMISFMYGSIQWLGAQGITGPFAAGSIAWWIALAFFVDLSFASVGYLLTLRLLDTHIRSANPLLLGWLVAIVCYRPFWDLIGDHYLRYAGPENWETWLAAYPALYAAWATALLALILFYAWATAAFGLRFSNLTHRGIVTSGPYALTKHPAYISKNIFWWMSAMPFLSASGMEFAITGCLLLGLVNLLYLVRARTEERHLSEDPAYADYARWIARHGLIARLAAFRRRLAVRLAGVAS